MQKRFKKILIAATFAALSQSLYAGNAEDRGRYLVKIAGCNDCHTPGYGEAKGNIPEDKWLVGNRIGYRGPWGTSYAQNLRLIFQSLTSQKWIEIVRTQEMDPPMPWFNLRAMTEADLNAIYDFIHGLGPAGEPTPDTVASGVEPQTPYILMVPQG